MKVVPKKHPAELVAPVLTEARTRAMWDTVDQKLHGRPHGRWPFAVAALASLAVALVILARPAASPLRAATGAVIHGDGARTLGFAGGTSVALAPHTRLTLLDVTATAIRVRLDTGSITCTVGDVAQQALTVEAGHVVATLGPGVHELAQDADHALRVHTLAGNASVRTHDGAQLAALRPGEEWSSIARTAAWVSPVASAPVAAPEPSRTAARPAKIDPAADASRIFARAEASRLDGNTDDAVHSFEALYRTYPGDPRAAIAALEAGRLRLRSDDLVAALAGMQFARQHAPEPFREDAHASEVDVLARLGRIAACHAARTEFLATYTASPHRDKVTTRCP